MGRRAIRRNFRPHGYLGVKMLFVDAVEGYWLERRRDLSRHTIDDYGRTFGRFDAFLGEDRELDSITADDVRAFLNALSDDGLAAKTVANAWIALSALWTWAEGELGAEHVIRNRVKRPRWRRPQIEPYSMDDVRRMLNECDVGPTWRTRSGRRAQSRRRTALRDRALIIVLVDTGIRAQELCDLVVDDYSRQSGQLLIRHGKGDKQRMVFVGDAGQRALWRYMLTRKEAGAQEPLFPTRTGTHLMRDNLRRLIQTIAKRADVQRATVHRFRHTFAVNFLRNGGNVLALQSLLGHEQMETIRLYVRLADVDLEVSQQRASPADHWRL